MYQNYPLGYYPQQNTNNRLGLKGHPVSSLEEVRATGIDFDGSVFFFPDLANKKIYTKQINMDGTAVLNVYELSQLPTDTNIPVDYITREEFETAITQLKNAISAPSNTPKQEFKF